jgi:hypothetical protein
VETLPCNVYIITNHSKYITFPFTDSDNGEDSRHSHHTTPNVVVTIRAHIPIAIARTAINSIIDPITATQQLKSTYPMLKLSIN